MRMPNRKSEAQPYTPSSRLYVYRILVPTLTYEGVHEKSQQGKHRRGGDPIHVDKDESLGRVVAYEQAVDERCAHHRLRVESVPRDSVHQARDEKQHRPGSYEVGVVADPERVHEEMVIAHHRAEVHRAAEHRAEQEGGEQGRLYRSVVGSVQVVVVCVAGHTRSGLIGFHSRSRNAETITLRSFSKRLTRAIQFLRAILFMFIFILAETNQ